MAVSTKLAPEVKLSWRFLFTCTKFPAVSSVRSSMPYHKASLRTLCSLRKPEVRVPKEINLIVQQNTSTLGHETQADYGGRLAQGGNSTRLVGSPDCTSFLPVGLAV